MISNLLFYFFEVSLILLLSSIIYAAFANKYLNYKWMRNLIIASLMLALLVPLLPNLSLWELSNYGITLPEVLIGTETNSVANSSTKANAGFSFLNGFIFIFFSISLVFLCRLFYGWGRILKLKHASRIDSVEVKNCQEHAVYFSSEIEQAFSFFEWIFIPDSFSKDVDIKTIVLHELEHVSLGHSLDKIVMESIKCFLWWHPSIWFFSNELSLVHEYQVDESMSKHMNLKKYKEILLQLILSPPGLRMTNSFSSNIKKRITMMNKIKADQSLMGKVIIFGVFAFGILSIHACTQDDNNSNKEAVTITKIEEPAEKYYMKNVKDTIITFDFNTNKEEVRYVSSDQKIYKHPEQMPMFPGCDNEANQEAKTECSTTKMLQFIYQNISYPAEAREKNIEGVVVVQFIVDKFGKISARNYVRKLGSGTEKSVDSMLDKMLEEITWIPGMANGEAVNVEYTLPIKFKLD